MHRIVLKGYYGFANLGDDILLLVSCRWIKDIFPDSELLVSTASTSADYLVPFTGNLVDKVVPIYPEPKADIIVHGGGGTFFDFQSGPGIYVIINKLINAFGPTRLEYVIRNFRKAKGWPGNPKTLRMALGIGVGGFTASSKKYYQKAVDLASFQLIMTRDQTSYQHLQTLGLNANLLKGTDLAFANQYWLEESNQRRSPVPGAIGFILRSWNGDPSRLQQIHIASKQLMENGFKVSIFLFESPRDSSISGLFKDIPLFPWQPNRDSLIKFVKILGTQSLLVTERAHGAILGSALGRPSVILGLEPKLQTIHYMLPNATVYQDYPCTKEGLETKIEKAFKITSKQVRQDFDMNHRILKKRLSLVKGWLQTASGDSDPKHMLRIMMSGQDVN